MPLLGLFFLLLLPVFSFSQRKKTGPPAPLPSPAAPVFDAAVFKGVNWRSIGPHRGGRANAIAGIPGNDQVYYVGYTGGGVWKTEDAGMNWTNISDGYFTTGTIGDIAVSGTDPNVIYVGSGEHAVRGVMTTFGDGVYKSEDAGKTWKNIGLRQSRHISDVLIHPQNPDLVYVGVQGAVHGSSTDRGVFKTTDGGQTWKKTLYIDENTGVSSLVMDLSNPRILYAATWQHRRYPWYVESGGPGSAIYKSIDGGESWEKLTSGLPAAMGKIGLSVAQANPQRIYALIEAEKSVSGMYRSDDGGATWALMSNNQIITARSWYYMEVFADPSNENIVYALNAPLMRSIDGGKTFENMRVIHGDCHDLWINPQDGRNLAMAEDGGATITFNQGKTWTTFNNQATAQLYRVTADKQVPYWVYSGQQDNLSVAIPTRTPDYGILTRHWYNGPGCESATVAFDDPYKPRILFGGCFNGRISLLDNVTMQDKDIQPYPSTNLGYEAKAMKYRYNWNAPLINSPHDARIMYYGGNVLFKTSDGGMTWMPISGDLTRNEPAKQGQGGGPFTNEGAGGENYNTIYAVAESSLEKDVLFTGSDCGLVHLTMDGGKSWKNVTPPGLPESSIHALEISPHQKGTVYIAANRYKFNDFKNYSYKSTDYGATWSKIGEDIQVDDFFRVIREDKVVPGLLYAGAERGFYISFDGGAHFHHLQLNMPVVPITDLTIQDNDLAASTAGRSFWILDDLSVFQQSKGRFTKDFQLFEPKTHYRILGAPQFYLITEHAFGKNPTEGVPLYYYLADTAGQKALKLDILDASGTIIRHYDGKSSLTASVAGERGNLLEDNTEAPLLRPGLNRFTWDFRTQGLDKLPVSFVLEADYRGHRVAPGTYKARMSYGTETQEVNIVILDHPQFKVPKSIWDSQQDLLEKLEQGIKDMSRSTKSTMDLTKQLVKIQQQIKDEPGLEDLKKAGDNLSKKINDWQNKVIELRQKGFQDALNWPAGIISEFFYIRSNLDVNDPTIPEGYKQRASDLQSTWQGFQNTYNDLMNNDVSKYNDMFKQKNLPALSAPKEVINN